MHNKPIKKIVIVGGGTAAWLLACRLAARYQLAADGFNITVIESPAVASVGVGEGTWPTMRATLKHIGISESAFMRSCAAAFKQGTCFQGWCDGAAGDRYYHPFELPKWHQGSYISEDWRRVYRQCPVTFDRAVSIQPSVCEQGLAPKHWRNAEYQGVLNYAYHLDAAAFASLLKTHGMAQLGIGFIRDHVSSVSCNSEGWISHLHTAEHGVIAGDFYFDCSGFNALLLNKTLGVDYVNLQNQLFVDSALAVQRPYDLSHAPVASATLSTAHAGGWIWDIGLRDRRGVGCVYSSAHITEAAALKTLAQYLGGELHSEVRQLKFVAQHLSQFWHKNAVAVGLSSGFVEPLEASALVLVELAADWFCERFPACYDAVPALSRRYNEVFREHWSSIVDFLKLHYVLSDRDEAFWRDNRESVSIAESLQERLSLWAHCPPSSADQHSDSKLFAWQSYLYIYNGMRRPEPRDISEISQLEQQLLRRQLQAVEKMQGKAKTLLPDNRSLLERLKSVDMSKI